MVCGGGGRRRDRHVGIGAHVRRAPVRMVRWGATADRRRHSG